MKPYSKQKLSALEKKILASVKKIQDAGVRIIHGEMGIDSGKFNAHSYPPPPNWLTQGGACCALSAVLLDKQPKAISKSIYNHDDIIRATMRAELGIDKDFLNGFFKGYDNSEYTDPFDSMYHPDRHSIHHNQGYNLGTKIGLKIFPPGK